MLSMGLVCGKKKHHFMKLFKSEWVLSEKVKGTTIEGSRNTRDTRIRRWRLEGRKIGVRVFPLSRAA